jgi:hypothetical protein
MTSIQYDERKLQELVLYIAAKFDGNETFGRTKLNKLLFFSDFVAYSRIGRPITGARYIHLPFGPCPDTMPKVESAIIGDRRAVQRQLSVGHFEEKRLVALDNANLDVFSASEISIVDEMIDRYWMTTATELSRISHGFVGWDLTGMKEEIPYFTALIPDAPLPISEEDMAEARRRAAALGL